MLKNMFSFKNISAKDLEKNNVKYFTMYLIWPTVKFFLIIGLFFIWGIIDALGNNVLNIGSGFFTWLIWTVIGTITAFLVYSIDKMHISYRILHIIYMQKLLNAQDQKFVSLINSNSDNYVKDINMKMYK